MGPEFRYTLTDLSIDYVLKYAPNGWDEETLGSYSRSKEYFGMTRKFSLPLRFVKDGAEILHNALLRDGVEAGVRLRVEQRNAKWGYDTKYLGDIDFSSYTYDGENFSVAVMESGITSQIKARESTTYEFPLTGSDVVNVIIPGVKFTDNITWSFSPTIQGNLFVKKKYIPAQDLITQSRSGFVQGFNVYQTNADDDSDFSGHVFIRNNRPNVISVRLFGKIKGYVVNAGGFPTSVNLSMDMHRISDGAAFYNLVYETGPWTISDIRPYEKEIDLTVTMQPGEAFYIYNKTGTSTGTAITNIIQEGELRAEYTSVSDPSNCKGLKPFDLFTRLINRVSPGTSVNSALLTGTWKDLIITSGSAIREIENPKIKISLKDFYQGFRGIDDVGIGTENGELRMETLPFFFRNVEAFNIGNVDTCTSAAATDWIYSKLSIGYESKTTNEPDGREGYNAKQEWQFPITRISNDMDLVSPFIADQYEIEKMRVQFNVKKESTSDANSDNDTFIIHCNPADVNGNYNPILGSQLEAVTGLTYPLSAYNVLISPKRNLLRHSGYFASMLDLLGTRYIEFASAEKNALLTSTVNGVIVEENKSVLVSTLGGKLFRPHIFTVNAKLPRNAMDILDANPYATIGFNFNGIECRGFILEFNLDLAGDSAQELILLAAPYSFLPLLL